MLAVVVLHLSTLNGVLSSDEGGFAMIARWLSAPGDQLYNTMWVDRPPLLIGVFRIATLLGPHGTRILATGLAVVLVLALAHAARLLAGPRAGVWTAWIAGALSSSTMFAAQQLNGEIIAATAVSLAMLAIVHAVRRGSGPSAFLAGLAAASAILIKQDFADGLVFLAVYCLLSARADRDLRSRLAGLWRWIAAGVVVPVAGTLIWALGHGGVGALAYAMYGFRLDASQLIGQTGGGAVSGRLHVLVGISLTSALVPVALCVLIAGARSLRRLEALPVALLAAFVVELVGVIGGGNYWPHYLIGFIPTMALAAGILAAQPGLRSFLVKLAGVGTVASAVLAVPLGAVANEGGSTRVATVSAWLHDSGEPGDTLTTLYSHASINYLANMRPAYPYAWSLPLRLRDPGLTLLSDTFAGPQAPTWVLGWDSMTAWGLNQSGNLSHALRVHYRQVATVCDKPVWLHVGLTRNLAATPRMGEC